MRVICNRCALYVVFFITWRHYILFEPTSRASLDLYVHFNTWYYIVVRNTWIHTYVVCLYIYINAELRCTVQCKIHMQTQTTSRHKQNKNRTTPRAPFESASIQKSLENIQSRMRDGPPPCTQPHTHTNTHSAVAGKSNQFASLTFNVLARRAATIIIAASSVVINIARRCRHRCHKIDGVRNNE